TAQVIGKFFPLRMAGRRRARCWTRTLGLTVAPKSSSAAFTGSAVALTESECREGWLAFGRGADVSAYEVASDAAPGTACLVGRTCAVYCGCAKGSGPTKLVDSSTSLPPGSSSVIRRSTLSLRRS